MARGHEGHLPKINYIIFYIVNPVHMWRILVNWTPFKRLLMLMETPSRTILEYLNSAWIREPKYAIFSASQSQIVFNTLIKENFQRNYERVWPWEHREIQHKVDIMESAWSRVYSPTCICGSHHNSYSFRKHYLPQRGTQSTLQILSSRTQFFHCHGRFERENCQIE